MKSFSVYFLVMFLLSVVPFSVRANDITHALGDTGYMIREAMHAHAGKLDHDNFRQAVKAQREAKKYMHGTHKKGRHISQIMELTRQAYELAKTARDNALAQKTVH